ncbi:hypothetical protein CH063_05657, partial [Colletotrichum higginsianum]
FRINYIHHPHTRSTTAPNAQPRTKKKPQDEDFIRRRSRSRCLCLGSGVAFLQNPKSRKRGFRNRPSLVLCCSRAPGCGSVLRWKWVAEERLCAGLRRAR